MAINCPNCNAVNRDEAKFCDNCGAALGLAAEAPARPMPAAAAAAPRTNWTAIILLLALVGVVGWLLFGPRGNGSTAGLPGSGTANPHASGGSANGDNPHGTGAQAGMPDIDGMKAKLDANPLDVGTLRDLYQTYGMINLGSKCRPYLDAAIAALLKQRLTYGEDWPATGRQIAAAALLGGDSDGALAALNQLALEAPDDLQTVLMLADVHGFLGQPSEAVDYYTKYLDAVTPEEAGDSYWQARVRRGAMELKAYEQSPDEQRDTAALEAALGELKEVVASQADSFDAWLSLGDAYAAHGDTQLAEDAYTKCTELAAGPQQDWQARAALAELHGEEPPPQPSSAGMGGMANPHGGMGSMANPHGGMGGGDSQGDGADDDSGNTT